MVFCVADLLVPYSGKVQMRCFRLSFEDCGAYRCDRICT